jgi:hypothetical protein
MKFIFSLMLFASFAAQASSPSILSMKERLRMHLWMNGIEDRPVLVKKEAKAAPILPEEIERPLRKI